MRHFNRGRKVFIYLLLFAFIFPNAYLPKTEASPNGAPELQSAVSGNADGMINAIVYANGKYIAVGDRGYIGQSPDGLQWTRIAAPVSNEATSWRSIVFAKNMYVAVGLNTSSTSTAKLMTSPDGENWTDRSSSIDGTILQKAVFLNDQFFAVGGRWSGNDRSLDVGIIYSSTDGVNWTLTAAPEKFWPVSSTTSTPFFLTDMAYISGRYVVGGNVFGSYGHSTNLSSWTKGFIDDYAISFFSVYNNKLYVISNGSNAYSSSDGITFAPAPDYNGMRGSLQDGSTLYRFGIGGNWFESADDGASWTQKTAITNVTILDAATNGSSFVLVTNGKNSLVVSPDHSIWSRIEGDLQGVVSNGSQWVGVATAPSRSGGEADSFLLTSSSGLGNLSPAADFFPNIEFYDVAYGNNTFIAIGKKIARSSDGVTWTLDDLPAGIAGQITAITYGSSQGFVAVTNGGSILASPDGSSWTVDNSNSGTAFSHVKDVNGVYIATVPYESVWVSDGSGGNWSALDSLSDYYALYYDLSDVTYGAGTYAISGSDENGNPVVLTAAANSLDEIAVWDTHAIDNSVYTTLKTIEYSDGYFVTGGLEYHSSSPETYVLYATSDFTNWADYNEQTLGISSSAINSITVLNGTFYIVGDNNARIVLGEPSGPVAQPEPTPAAVISFTDEQLTGLAANAVYLINGQNISTDANGKVAIDSAWLGGSLSIVKVGNGTTSTNSPAQSLIIPDRPAAPTGVGKTDESYAGANDGSLTGLPVGGEYKQGAAGAWSDISSATVSGLQPDTYYVRTKATSSAFVSEEAAITVGSTSATPEVTPAAVISFTDEQLTGLAANAVYLINGQNVSADLDGKIAIDSAWLGETLSIVKVGNGTTSTNSSAQSLIIPDRPAAPTGVGKTDESYAGANDGSLTGLPVGGEYKQGAAGAWSDISSATVSGLQPDTYYVRTKATSSAFASEEATAVIGTLPAVPVAPNVSADDINDQIIGLDTTMEYQIDGGNYVRFDGNNLPVLNGSHTVKVRVAANGSVPAGAEVTLYFTAPVAAGLTVTAVDPSGTANDGKTTISAVPAATVIGHKLVYKTFGSSEVIPPKVGDAATGYADLPANGLINAAHGEKIGVAEVDADGKIVKFGFTTAVVVQEQTSGGNTNVPTAPPIITGPSSNETDVIVIVNGQIENAGKSKTTEINGLTTTTVIVDPQKLQAKLDSQGDGAIVTVPVSSSSSIIKGELNGQSIQNMDNRSATLVLRTDHASYRIPAREINIGQLAEKLSPGTKLSDISVNIIIAEPSDETNQVVQNSAIRGNFTVIVPSVDFKLIVSHKDKSIEITNFSMYVERKIALPDNVDPNKITTGIVVDPNGVNRHVPTKVIVEDGTHYAVINSLTNSTYSVVWHPLIFADMENHWAKDAVNDMGSRMIVNGVDSSTFSPNKDITRAEFAAMVVRGLGLRLGEGTHPFNDVNEQNWYSSAVQTAASYNLIAGFEDGTFRPNATITREQAMIIIARAMKLTGLAATTGMPDADELLSSFTDSAAASRWSKEGIALAVKAGVVGGRSDGRLDAKANITRAEVAAIIQRLLKKSDLI